jgi:hypothetical protein
MVIVNVFLTILKVDQDYVNDVYDRQNLAKLPNGYAFDSY